MSVAALPLHFNQVHSSCTGSLSKMTCGIESETHKISYPELRKFFWNLNLHLFLHFLLTGKTIKGGISIFFLLSQEL